MARSNHVALPGPNDPYWDDDGEWQRDEWREHEPWRIEGITVAQWLARRPDLVSLTVPPAAEEWWFAGMREHPPETSGVYFLIDEAGSVLYVGKATSIGHRIHAHWRNQTTPFYGAQWRVLPIRAAEVLEAYLIHKMQPPCNVQFRGHDWSRQVAEAIKTGCA